MIPVMQTTFYEETPEGKTRGNCFVACVASILEVPIHAVPDWPRKSFGRSNWMLDVQNYLNMFDLEIEMVFKRFDEEKEIPLYLQADTETFQNHGYYIVSGPSPRFGGKIWHACVWHKGEIVHDPYPGGGGLAVCREWELIKPVAIWDATK